MKNFPLPRIDKDPILKKYLTQYCRLKFGDSWQDPEGRHKIACLDSSDFYSIKNLIGSQKFQLAVHDPPYNMIAFDEMDSSEFVNWCKIWIESSYKILDENSSLYIELTHLFF